MMAINKKTLLLLCLSCYFFFCSPSFLDSDALKQGQQLDDGEHLVSADKTFKLGFFSPGTSKNRYLGIWYNVLDDENATFFDTRKVVWVANRNIPIVDDSGVLVIDELGKLKVSYNGGSSIVLSSVQSRKNSSAMLLDSGNFVFMEMNPGGSAKDILWQSFDYPTNTLLPGMKLGLSLKTAHVWSLTSWRSENNPAEGSFSLTIGVGINGSSQLITWWKRSVYWTSGVWQNGHFELVPTLSNEGAYAFFTNDSQADCEIWSKGMRFAENNSEGREIYVLNHSKKAKWWIWLVIAVIGLVAVLVFSFVFHMIKKRRIEAKECPWKDLENKHELLLYEMDASTTNKQKRDKKNHELQIFSFESIASATNNFANTNKLGEGGFGPVYKGKLKDGQEIAVKRLSRSSGQGLLEFKNELVLIAKLQHTNLVRLVGCCIQREEKMLIYEYMLNKSLDIFLFGMAVVE